MSAQPLSIPAILLQVEAETLAGVDYGGFEFWGDKLVWSGRWVGDAASDDYDGSGSRDVTREAIRSAREIVESVGYATGDSEYDHDSASFEILGVKEGMETVVYCPKCQGRDIDRKLVSPLPQPHMVSMDELGQGPFTVVPAVLQTSRWRATCQGCGYFVEYNA